MSHVLVLVDASGGPIRKPTLELLTLARRFGRPAAVIFGPEDPEAVEELGRYGAAAVYIVDDPVTQEYLVLPKVEALAEIAGRLQAEEGLGAVLVGSGPEGKEIAARLAVRLGWGNMIYGITFRVTDLDSAESWLSRKGIRTWRIRPTMIAADPADCHGAPYFFTTEEVENDPYES